MFQSELIFCTWVESYLCCSLWLMLFFFYFFLLDSAVFLFALLYVFDLVIFLFVSQDYMSRVGINSPLAYLIHLVALICGWKYQEGQRVLTVIQETSSPSFFIPNACVIATISHSTALFRWLSPGPMAHYWRAEVKQIEWRESLVWLDVNSSR